MRGRDARGDGGGLIVMTISVSPAALAYAAFSIVFFLRAATVPIEQRTDRVFESRGLERAGCFGIAAIASLVVWLVNFALLR